MPTVAIIGRSLTVFVMLGFGYCSSLHGHNIKLEQQVEHTSSQHREKRAPEDLKTLPATVYNVGGRFDKAVFIKSGKTAAVVFAEEVKDKHGNKITPPIPVAIKIADSAKTKRASLAKEVAILRAVSKLDGFPRLVYPDPENQQEKVGSSVHDKLIIHFLAMTRVGPDLMSLLVRGDQMKEEFVSLQQAVQWILQIEKTMRLLHQAGYSHNDIAESNLCVDLADLKKAVLIDLSDASEFDLSKPVPACTGMTCNGPTRDYDLLVRMAARVFAYFNKDAGLQKRFPKSQNPMTTQWMIAEAKKLFLPESKSYESLAQLHTKVGDEFEKLLTDGVKDVGAAWFPEWKPVDGPLVSSWSKAKTITLLSRDEVISHGK